MYQKKTAGVPVYHVEPENLPSSRVRQQDFIEILMPKRVLIHVLD